jgi:hypothetical protein
MKYLIAVAFLFTWLPSRAQRHILPSGEFMDTTVLRQQPCATVPLVRYYSVNGKYPRSSETLAKGAQEFLRRQNQSYSGSGYVTFRFIVDCAGHRQPKTQVLQTDTNYKRFHFRKELVEGLYSYLQTLTEWPVAQASQSVNYVAYLTFKLKDGKVIAVIP